MYISRGPQISTSWQQSLAPWAGGLTQNEKTEASSALRSRRQCKFLVFEIRHVHTCKILNFVMIGLGLVNDTAFQHAVDANTYTQIHVSIQ